MNHSVPPFFRPWRYNEICQKAIVKMDLLQETAQRLFETFINRRDAFAIQLEDGRYFASYQEITVEHVMEHLKGEITLAVYLLNSEGMTKYSVLDADDGEGLDKLVKSTRASHYFLTLSRLAGVAIYGFSLKNRSLEKLPRTLGLKLRSSI